MKEHDHIWEKEVGAQALGVLVKQFSGRFDFIRELVQNSLDSGTAVVEVWTKYHPLETGGVCEIHVDDNGCGMDEATIDARLTTLFSSSKEDDLTNIGKFGIGFASIFSIEPDGVLVRTAKSGERWEIFFHKDRTFEKTRLDDPIEGTKITLFKAMSPAEYKNAVENVVQMLKFWCKHAERRILFHDAHAAVSNEIEGGGPGRRRRRGGPRKEEINEPFSVTGDFPVTVEKGETLIAMAFSETPFFGFYNQGLTLKETNRFDVFGWAAPFFKNVVFKIKSAYLEHTLTRDTILLDDNFEKALLLLVETARAALVEKLLCRLETLASQETLNGEDRDEYLNALDWLAKLQWELDPTFDFMGQVKDISFNTREYLRRATKALLRQDIEKNGTQKSIDASNRKLFRRCHGGPCTMDDIRKSASRQGNRVILSALENDATEELFKFSIASYFAHINDDTKRFFAKHVTGQDAVDVFGEGCELPTVFGVGEGVWPVEHLEKRTLTAEERRLFDILSHMADAANMPLKPVNFLGDNPLRHVLGARLIEHGTATTIFPADRSDYRPYAVDVKGRLFQKLTGLLSRPETRDLALLLAGKEMMKSASLDNADRAAVMQRAAAEAAS